MSLNVVPVCGSCGKSSAVSISCTKCFKICCSTCFSGLVSAMMTADVDIALLTARVCRKCETSNGGESAGCEADVHVHKSATAQGQCNLHGTKCRLYCVNCSVGICGICIDQGEPHYFHRIDNLDTVYLDKAFTVLSKLLRAEKLNDEMHAGTAVYRRNLSEVEEEEESLLKEIQAVYEASKLVVTRITTARKEALRAKLKVPAMNGEILQNLRNDINQLSPYEFLEHLPEFENKYDVLNAQQNDMTLQTVDDIYCDLVPQYQFTEIVLRSFSTAADGTVCVFRLPTAYHFEWKLTVRKANMLQVEPNSEDPEVQKFRHMLVVTIQHPDYMKTVKQTFELEGQLNTFDVAYSSYLVEHGFCDEHTGHLVLRVGIRGLNVIIERQLLNYKYNHVDEAIEKATENNYLTMRFDPKLSELQNGVTLKSGQIKDNENRRWCLMMILLSNDVELYLELVKGPKACSVFFIELIHSDPKKTITNKSSKCDFDPTTAKYGKGWQKFISFDTLKNDVGFYPDGKLHIRCGVRPVETSAPSAANA